MTPRYYSVFGLWVQADRPITRLVPLPVAPAVDVQVWLGGEHPPPGKAVGVGTQPWYVSSDRDERGRPALTILRLADNAGFRLRFGDGAGFVIDRTGGQVWAEGAIPSPEEMACYLLGPVLAFVLCLHGVTCLHASAVAVGGRAVAFLGPSGAGKSTIAATLARRGHPVLADDLLALSDLGDSFVAQPGCPRLWLRPASTSILGAAGGTPPRLRPTPDRQYLDLDLLQDGYCFQRWPLPLAAVYFLDERRAVPSAPSIVGFPGGDRLLTLVANTWATRVLDRAMRAEEFERLGRLAAFVPVRCVYPPAEAVLLPRLCDAIVADLQERFTVPLPTVCSNHGS